MVDDPKDKFDPYYFLKSTIWFDNVNENNVYIHPILNGWWVNEVDVYYKTYLMDSHHLVIYNLDMHFQMHYDKYHIQHHLLSNAK
jgi:hypothetical protein